MAKVSAVNKNNRRKKMIQAQAKSRAELKKITEDLTLPFDARFEAMVKLSEKPRNSSSVRYKNRCALTGRPRAYHGHFKLSRVCLRELGLAGLIPGLVKSSW